MFWPALALPRGGVGRHQQGSESDHNGCTETGKGLACFSLDLPISGYIRQSQADVKQQLG
jgi:hypothetical protein